VTKRSIYRLVTDYEKYREKTLNLIPSENVLSHDVLRAMSSGMAGRYAGRPESYGGSKIFHEVWNECEKLATKIFRSKHASVAPISGHMAGMMAIDALCKRGDQIAVISSDDGGYKGYNQGLFPDVIGLRVSYLPFDSSSFNVDSGRAVAMIKSEKPEVVILGATVFLFPHPVKEIAEAVHSYGGKVIYDGSHVLGLIAGRSFQDPLSEGADLLLGSTHKTLFGPQGGIIISNNEEMMAKIEGNFLCRFIDNFHLNRVASLGIALEEIEVHGKTYADKVTENSKALAKQLDLEGLPVGGKKNGFTESHQVLLTYGPRGSEIRDNLESNEIIVDSRVRLGTNEVTRRGMGPKQMNEIARLVSLSIAKKASPKIRKEVEALSSHYRKIHFTLKN
jgi:glycine hydroxymethyltransferase